MLLYCSTVAVLLYASSFASRSLKSAERKKEILGQRVFLELRIVCQTLQRTITTRTTRSFVYSRPHVPYTVCTRRRVVSSDFTFLYQSSMDCLSCWDVCRHFNMANVDRSLSPSLSLKAKDLYNRMKILIGNTRVIALKNVTSIGNALGCLQCPLESGEYQQVSQSLNYKSRNVIYLWKYKCYFGRTTRKCHEQTNGHRSSFNDEEKKWSTPRYRYANLCHTES